MATKIASAGEYPGSSAIEVYGTYTNSTGDSYTEYWAAYGPFNVSAGTWDLTTVKINLRRVLTNTSPVTAGNVVLSLHSGTIGGSEVDSVTYDRTTLPEETHVFAEFAMVGEVSSGIDYFLVLKDPSGFVDEQVDPDETDIVPWQANPATSAPCLQHNSVSGWTSAGTRRLIFEVYGDAVGGGPTKTESPTPTDSDTGVDFSGLQLSWDDGGGADTFNVYIGETGSLTRVSLLQAGTTYTTTMAELESIFGTSPIDQKIYWRVDATNVTATTEGDEWNFDARPAKATVPSPTNTATGTVLGLTTTWTGGATATTYNMLVDVGDGLESQETALEDATWTPAPTIFDYITEYTWRVDSINSFGTTTGDEWTFTTLRFTPPGVTYWYSTTNVYYRLLVQDDDTYGDHPPIGVADTDYVVVTYEPNFIRTNRVLVAVAENRFWYEDIT